MDDRELDTRLTKIEQGIAFLVQKEIEFEKENIEEPSNVIDNKEDYNEFIEGESKAKIKRRKEDE